MQPLPLASFIFIASLPLATAQITYNNTQIKVQSANQFSGQSLVGYHVGAGVSYLVARSTTPGSSFAFNLSSTSAQLLDNDIAANYQLPCYVVNSTQISNNSGPLECGVSNRAEYYDAANITTSNAQASVIITFEGIVRWYACAVQSFTYGWVQDTIVGSFGQGIPAGEGVRNCTSIDALAFAVTNDTISRTSITTSSTSTASAAGTGLPTSLTSTSTTRSTSTSTPVTPVTPGVSVSTSSVLSSPTSPISTGISTVDPITVTRTRADTTPVSTQASSWSLSSMSNSSDVPTVDPTITARTTISSSISATNASQTSTLPNSGVLTVDPVSNTRSSSSASVAVPSSSNNSVLTTRPDANSTLSSQTPSVPVSAAFTTTAVSGLLTVDPISIARSSSVSYSTSVEYSTSTTNGLVVDPIPATRASSTLSFSLPESTPTSDPTASLSGPQPSQNLVNSEGDDAPSTATTSASAVIGTTMQTSILPCTTHLLAPSTTFAMPTFVSSMAPRYSSTAGIFNLSSSTGSYDPISPWTGSASPVRVPGWLGLALAVAAFLV